MPAKKPLNQRRVLLRQILDASIVRLGLGVPRGSWLKGFGLGPPALSVDVNAQPLRSHNLPHADRVIKTARSAGAWRIAFGSCAKQSVPQPIWAAVTRVRPHLFVFLVDNFYADALTPEELARRHDEFRKLTEVNKFRSEVPHLAIWDDHDYGVDDAGAEYLHKELSQRLFCDTWMEPEDSPRRRRAGIYTSALLTDGVHTIQFLLPDLRFHRSELRADAVAQQGYEKLMETARSGTPVPGWYRSQTAHGATLLGHDQWLWLEEQLRQPADLRIICSSIQFAAQGSGWECWSNFPAEHQRLLDLLANEQTGGVLFISGDMHYGEISRLDSVAVQSIWDITSSGLTETWKVPTPNANRIQGPYTDSNFGTLEVHWAERRVRATIHQQDGRVALQQDIQFNRSRS